jgi:oligopeptidase B
MPQPPVAPRKAHTWPRPTGNVEDPWAWLRDKNDPDTIAYLTAENTYADAWFTECTPSIDTLFEEIKSRVVETDMSVPVRHGGWWYVTRTQEGLAYPIHCRGTTKDTAHTQVLIDENAEAQGHEYFALGVAELSDDHTLMAWSRDLDGSEQYEMRIRDLTTGLDLTDVLTETSYGGAAFSLDNRHLFYVVNDEMMRPYRVMRHEIGTQQSADVEVFVDHDERFFVGVGLTRSGKYLVIESGSRTSGECHVLDAAEPLGSLTCVRPRQDDIEYSVDHWGDQFLVLTNLEAQDFQVMTAPHATPGEWTTLVPHETGRRIVDLDAFADFIAIQEWQDAQPRLRLLQRDGSSRIVTILDEPHDVELGANPEWNTRDIRTRFQSLVTPPTVGEYNLDTNQMTILKTTPVPGVNLDAYEAVREWAVADDGVRVPLDIVRKKTTQQDGTAPGVLYGYGSYEYSIAPHFSVSRFSLLDRGWVWSLAHPRGGGELGRSWYENGKLLSKRNTFTDTIACARHLVANTFVRPRGIALFGGSAGGLLVGACINMAPEQFGAAVAAVPFVDVVTTMSDPSLPLTVTEWEEWGDPRQEPWASYMLSYSPYDNVAPADYPPLYVTAGLNDPRVSFHEPAKWVAKLRALPQPPTVYFRCEMGAGHGGPSGRYEHWRDEAHILAFMLRQLWQRPGQ